MSHRRTGIGLSITIPLQRVAGAVALDDQDRVLLVWRHRFITKSWGWELPGGIVDSGETSAEAARRETVEETGWRPDGSGEDRGFQRCPDWWILSMRCTGVVGW